MAHATVSSTFPEKLLDAQRQNRSLLCVGLDPVPSKFPAGLGRGTDAIVAFNRAIIEATVDVACCYKPNLGFYLPFGAAGIDALTRTQAAIPDHIPVLLDAKMGDIDTTSVGYAAAVFDTWGFDAVTVNPYLGHDALEPFLAFRDRGVFVLAKTSNPGSGLLQDQRLASNTGDTVALRVARQARSWNTAGNVGLVVGATWPAQLAEIRQVAPDLPILVPGVGAQAGDIEAAVRAGVDASGAGLLVNASRAICYASDGVDFQDAARRAAEDLRDQIEAARGRPVQIPSS